MINDIEKIMRGSSFILWASLKFDKDIENKYMGYPMLMANMKSLHLYEIKGIADTNEDTVYITADIFINNKRVFEAATSISYISTDPNEFCTILEKAQSAAMNYLQNSYSDFLKRVVPDSLGESILGIDSINHLSYINDMIEEHLYVGDLSTMADEAAMEGKDISSDDIPRSNHAVEINKFTLPNASHEDTKTQKIVFKMFNHITQYIRYMLDKEELFTVEINYETTTSVGDSFSATTILDSDTVFNNITTMLGGMSFYGDSLISPPVMNYYTTDNDIVTEYANDVMSENIFKTLNLIYKITSNQVIITVKTGKKEEEDFWDYV